MFAFNSSYCTIHDAPQQRARTHTERAERPRWEPVFAFLTSPCEAPGRAPTTMCATDRLPVVWNLPFERTETLDQMPREEVSMYIGGGFLVLILIIIILFLIF